MHRVRTIILVFLTVTSLTNAAGQTQDGVFMIRQQGYARLNFVAQKWSSSSNTDNISEYSVPVFAYIPLNLNTSLSVQAGQADVRSDLTSNLSGLTDMQFHLTRYYEPYNLIFSFKVNLPVGKKELTLDEFDTTYLISLNMYDFRVPVFGQGLNIAPGISWASSLSETIAVGLGASYQYRGAYKPFHIMEGQYNPGNEFLITGGLDFKVGQNSTLTTDLIYTRYSVDKVGEDEVFKSGGKFVFHAQLSILSGNKSWLFSSTYRSKDKNQVAIAGGLEKESEKTVPDEFVIKGRYRFPVGRRMSATINGEGRYFKETSAFEKVSIFCIGGSLNIPLNQKSIIPVSIKLSTGSIASKSISGFEFAFGIFHNF